MAVSFFFDADHPEERSGIETLSAEHMTFRCLSGDMMIDLSLYSQGK
jgi:hypothetical protein